MNLKKYNEAYAKKDESASRMNAFKIIEEEYCKNQYKFDQWPIPSKWERNIPLECHIETPMHLLYLGIAKSIFLRCNDWLSCRNQLKIQAKKNSSLLSLVENLRLDWCKIVRFDEGTFGGWVSENYVGLMKISLWVFSTFQELPSMINGQYHLSGKETFHWTLKHLCICYIWE